MKDDTTIRGAVHTDLQHDSAVKHVTGSATYTDDIAEPVGTLHAYLGVSTETHARIRNYGSLRRPARRRAWWVC